MLVTKFDLKTIFQENYIKNLKVTFNTQKLASAKVKLTNLCLLILKNQIEKASVSRWSIKKN